MPLYLTNFQGKESLIRASTLAGARNHLLKPLVPDIKQLDAEGVAAAMGRGLIVEDAGAAEVKPDANAGDAK